MILNNTLPNDFFSCTGWGINSVSILYRKDTHLDGKAPLLLYGYGAYGIIPASFNISRLSLVDRGFIYAIAHIRGGMDRLPMVQIWSNEL